MRSRLLSVFGALLEVATDVLYVILLRAQPDDPQSLRPPFIVGLIALLAVAALLASSTWARASRLPLLAFAATGLMALGFLAGFSIGVALLAAGLLLLLAALQPDAVAPRVHRPVVVASASAALLILVVGMQLTEFPTGCPTTGYSAGSGTALITRDYHWTCINGKLTILPGACNHGGATVNAANRVVDISGC